MYVYKSFDISNLIHFAMAGFFGGFIFAIVIFYGCRCNQKNNNELTFDEKFIILDSEDGHINLDNRVWIYILESVRIPIFFSFFLDFFQKIFSPHIWFYFDIREGNSKGRSGYTFLLILQKNFCRFLTPKVKSATDMINPSIESFDFLFWHKKKFWVGFLKILSKTDKPNFIFWNLGCVYTHKIWTREMYFACFPQNFQKSDFKFFHAKIENQSFRLMGWSYLYHFQLSVWESGKSFFVKWVKSVPWAPFWNSPL